MSRPIDHLVVVTESLSVSAARLESLGFQVAPPASHPFGTVNRCVYFEDGSYLETLAVEDRQKVETAVREGSCFLRRSEAFRFRNGEGAAMLAFGSSDAADDARRFREAGYSDGTVLTFSRGSGSGRDAKEVSFALALASDARAPDVTLFACERRGTEHLFSGGGVRHPNGAQGIVEVAMTEPNPSDFQYLLECASGVRDLRATSLGIEARVGNSDVRILTPDGFEMVYGAPVPPAGRGPVLRGVTISVTNLGRLSAILAANGVSAIEIGERLVVAPEPGLAVYIAFVKAT